MARWGELYEINRLIMNAKIRHIIADAKTALIDTLAMRPKSTEMMAKTTNINGAV